MHDKQTLQKLLVPSDPISTLLGSSLHRVLRRCFYCSAVLEVSPAVVAVFHSTPFGQFSWPLLNFLPVGSTVLAGLVPAPAAPFPMAVSAQEHSSALQSIHIFTAFLSAPCPIATARRSVSVTNTLMLFYTILHHCQGQGKGFFVFRKGVPFLLRGKHRGQRVCPPLFFIVLGLVSIFHVNHPLFAYFCY